MSKQDVLCEVLQLKRTANGSLGEESPAAAQFLAIIFLKNATLKPLNYISTVFRAIWKN